MKIQAQSVTVILNLNMSKDDAFATTSFLEVAWRDKSVFGLEEWRISTLPFTAQSLETLLALKGRIGNGDILLRGGTSAKVAAGWIKSVDPVAGSITVGQPVSDQFFNPPPAWAEDFSQDRQSGRYTLVHGAFNSIVANGDLSVVIPDDATVVSTSVPPTGKSHWGHDILPTWGMVKAARAAAKVAIEVRNREIEEFLRLSYEMGSNPLPAMRGKYGGQWEFVADCSVRVNQHGHAISSLPKVGKDAIMFSPEEGNWRVYWTPPAAK